MDYELECAREKLCEAAQLKEEADNLPNPGPWKRQWLEMLHNADGTTMLDRQHEIDTHREELEARVTELLSGAAGHVRPWLDSLAERGLDRDRIRKRLVRLMQEGTPSAIRQALAELEALQHLLDIKDDALSRIAAARDRIAESVHSASERYDVDTEIRIQSWRS